MKKLIVLFVFLTLNFALLTLNSFAQPNGGFESWTPEFSYENPDGWQTLNFLSILTPPNPLSAFKAIGLDVHSGNYALKLKTVHLINNPLPAQIHDTISIAFTGKINISPVAYKVGYPYTGRPEKLEFWAKYSPVGGDVAGAAVVLLKWNGTVRDTIAFGKVDIPATTAYSFVQLPLTYKLTELPDSAGIVFSSSADTVKARVGSTLFIDDVAFTGWVGIDQYELNSKVQLFPNPAKDNITIQTQSIDADNIKVVDISGKLLGVYKIQNYNTSVSTTMLPTGTYFYDIRDKKNRVLAKGKFSVIR